MPQQLKPLVRTDRMFREHRAHYVMKSCNQSVFRQCLGHSEALVVLFRTFQLVQNMLLLIYCVCMCARAFVMQTTCAYWLRMRTCKETTNTILDISGTFLEEVTYQSGIYHRKQQCQKSPIQHVHL